MQGALQPGSIPRLLGELSARARSGALRLARRDQSVVIWLREGRIAAVETTPGRQLPATPAALQGSLERRLGSLLRDLGISAPRQAVDDGAALKDALSWQEGQYVFEEQATGIDAESAVVNAAAPEHVDDPVVLPPHEDPEARPAQGPGDRSALDLTAHEDAPLPQLDGERPIPEDPAAALPQPPLAVDAPAFVDDGATAKRRREIQDAVLHLLQADHFQALGITRDAGDRQVKDAYLQRVKRFHPDRHAEPALADLKQQLEALLIRMGEAYEVLRHTGRRARYEAELASRDSPVTGRLLRLSASQGPEQDSAEELDDSGMAEQAIRQAEQLMSESRYFDAIQLLEAVIPRIQSTNLKHAAQVRLARVYARNPHWVRRSEDLLHRVVREDPSRADAYFVLGTLYRERGLKNRALAMFRKVLDLNPRHGPALAQIRSLEQATSAGKLTGRI
jgi:tetratricopeptide (TPR) repeat protein